MKLKWSRETRAHLKLGSAVCHVAFCTVGYPSEFRVYEIKRGKYEAWLWTPDAKVEDMSSRKLLPMRLKHMKRLTMTLNEGKQAAQQAEDTLCEMWTRGRDFSQKRTLPQPPNSF